MNFRGGPGRNALGGGGFESNSHAANGLSFEEAMEAARFADLGGIITADDYETSSVSCLLGPDPFARIQFFLPPMLKTTLLKISIKF